MNPWPILAGLFAGTGGSIIVLAVMLPYRLGDMKRRFEDYMEKTEAHSERLDKMGEDIVRLRERMAAATGRANGGSL